MNRRPHEATRPDPPVPYTTRFRLTGRRAAVSASGSRYLFAHGVGTTLLLSAGTACKRHAFRRAADARKGVKRNAEKNVGSQHMTRILLLNSGPHGNEIGRANV